MKSTSRPEGDRSNSLRVPQSAFRFDLALAVHVLPAMDANGKQVADLTALGAVGKSR